MGHKSRTKVLREFVDAKEEPVPTASVTVLPEAFILGLRAALDSGMSCEQITAMLFVMSGINEVLDTFGREELMGRVRQLVGVMVEDKRRAGSIPNFRG